jgi:DNA-binding MarR family transcriptional regulator
MSEREFLGIWIPAEVWLDQRLTITEKAFLAEVESFSKNGKTFHKSNDTIRQQYGITPKTVQRIIKKLVQLELLECHFNGRVRHLSLGSMGKMTSLHRQNDESASSKFPHTNTVERTTKNTSKKEVVYPFTQNEFLEMWQTWLQERRDRRYKSYTYNGEQAALHNLKKMANNDHRTAIAIIQQSIAQGYQGLFELKGSSARKRPELDREQALAWASGK